MVLVRKKGALRYAPTHYVVVNTIYRGLRSLFLIPHSGHFPSLLIIHYSLFIIHHSSRPHAPTAVQLLAQQAQLHFIRCASQIWMMLEAVALEILHQYAGATFGIVFPKGFG